ncbi:MAG: 50S ribosomal protein L25 [Candidatus Omnitrophica bacterium]|nr:50S ribosomal protein L25 [Candidatus Omnitrophota bacterium]MDD5429846.1 50S ribosomal protein L25 [Candidatus Omnitrophota bacterium]
MDRIKIKTEKREKIGKEAVKKMRKEGHIPAVVYGQGFNLSLSIPLTGLKGLRSINFSESTIIDMEISGSQEQELIPVMIKDVQFNPLTEEVSHIDFLKVSLKEKIKVNIPIILKGETKAAKDEGAMLEQVLRELEVEGLPLDIPEKVEVDISELVLGHSLHVKDIKIADNIKVITEPQETVATLVVKKEEEVVVEEALVGEVPVEPEVIKEKKEDSAAGDKKEEKKPDKKADKKAE